MVAPDILLCLDRRYGGFMHVAGSNPHTAALILPKGVLCCNTRPGAGTCDVLTLLAIASNGTNRLMSTIAGHMGTAQEPRPSEP